jgi:hypothetical protein
MPIKYALAAVLCSPRFLYLEEEQRTEATKRKPLAPTELARRLAYFLWSDLPDEALEASAASGALLDGKELLAQERRMLADPRSKAFREHFCGEWLKIDKLEKVPIAEALFPYVDLTLIESAKEESIDFFSEILDKNLNLATFIDSDFTMLNARLAKLYGIPGVTGNEFRRVQLAPGSHRGGVLTQASVLIATSNGMVSSPVRRGALVMDRLLGVSPGSPPPNVPAFGKIDSVRKDGTPLSPRERLALHRVDISCARCHDKIDPLGVGLENYNAIGAWDDKLRLLVPDKTKDGKPVWMLRDADVHGQMLDGTAYNGPDELKQHLLEHQDAFSRSFAENLVIYALGRGLEESDRAVLDRICTQLKHQGDGLASLIDLVVTSELFMDK